MQQALNQTALPRPPRLPACQSCAQKKTKCDNSRPKCSLCARNGTECVISSGDAKVSRALLDELEKREKSLVLKLRDLESDPADTVQMLSPEETQTARSMAGSSPVARGGAGLGFVAHLFADANWRKSHANLLRTLVDVPGAAEASIAPCSLPSAVEARQLFDKYLSWSHIQSPFLLRREVWALYHRLFTTPTGTRDAIDPDLFRAFMICAIASVLPYRNGIHHQHPEGYYHAALQHLGPELLTRGVDSVQDLLLVCRFGIYHPIGTSIWDVVRLCGRLCIELGLHTDAGDHLDLLEQQRRRRVFWQFYLIDRYSSTTLDRPFLIDDRDIETRFPIEATDEEIEAASPDLRDLDSFCRTQNSAAPSEMTIFFVSVRLRQISSHIQTEFSRLKREHGEPSPRHLMAGHVHVVLNKLLQELENWRKNTPMIQDPSCLYETQEWYDLLHARERLSVVRRAIDLVPKVNGSPSKQILALLLKSALQTIERYCILCQMRDLMTHTRSYFHMLFTAGLSVMYCISVPKSIDRENLRASYEGLIKCEETLVSMARQLPDAHNYVAVFEALRCDISRKLRPNMDMTTVGSAADGSLTIGDLTNPLPTAEPGSMSANLGNVAFLPSQSQGFNQMSNGRVQLADAMDQVTGGTQPDGASYQDGSSTVDLMNWALHNYDSLWYMESALGEYVYGDPTNAGIWEGFEF
ncbi:Fungal-trans domain-containing protein [Fusarium falciforme]|uniref:Fungal-trans domain-containing protein n=1 Tax=Fusarium falciforme TaxID=195108 RepID=UPI0023008C21|nr:Fungal-trans domain-containing protein [Fusarium falciforme]WAO84867.1 Fungal-trans domain-containing protein [Fusarium falciforme]